MNSDIITKYFPNITTHQKVQIESLYSLYDEWNKNINVISRKDFSNLYIHHVLHSLSVKFHHVVNEFIPLLLLMELSGMSKSRGIWF